MDNNNKFLSILLAASISQSIFAVTTISLNKKPLATLRSYFTNELNQLTNPEVRMKKISSDIDFHSTSHIRLIQTYNGIEVLGSEAIAHLPNSRPKELTNAIHKNSPGFLTGVIYDGIEKDLEKKDAALLSQKQKVSAIKAARSFLKDYFPHDVLQLEDKASKKVIYIDENHKAHYSFLLGFYFEADTGPKRPTVIVDAENLQIVKAWDEIMHYLPVPKDAIPVKAGGVGGNVKVGAARYDGIKLSSLDMMLYEEPTELNGKTILVPMCYLANDQAFVVDVSYDKIANGHCPLLGNHVGNIRWLSNYQSDFWEDDSVNGGYSPSLDILYGAKMVSEMYKQWYGISVYVGKDGKPKPLELHVHHGRKYGDAFWDNVQEIAGFGDGNRTFYPLTSLSVTAHELSHAFTQNHSNLDRSFSQSAAIAESFSDMASRAAEYFVFHKTNWIIGESVLKNPDGVVRYLDEPTKDGLSVDNVKAFDAEFSDLFRNPHLDAGIFNKAFYLIATSPNWDIKKAFDIMVQANRFYWVSTISFQEAACGVLLATQDYKYESDVVVKAFGAVGLDLKKC